MMHTPCSCAVVFLHLVQVTHAVGEGATVVVERPFRLAVGKITISRSPGDDFVDAGFNLAGSGECSERDRLGGLDDGTAATDRLVNAEVGSVSLGIFGEERGESELGVREQWQIIEVVDGVHEVEVIVVIQVVE